MQTDETRAMEVLRTTLDGLQMDYRQEHAAIRAMLAFANPAATLAPNLAALIRRNTVAGGFANTVAIAEEAFEMGVKSAAPPAVERKGVVARFTVEIRHDGSTGAHTQAMGVKDAFLTIDQAISALLHERIAMRDCPVHLEPRRVLYCPFCGETATHPDRNFNGDVWVTCSNRNCGASAPEAVWNLRRDLPTVEYYEGACGALGYSPSALLNDEQRRVVAVVETLMDRMAVFEVAASHWREKLTALDSPTLHPSDREEGVERVAQAIADIKGGLNYDYMDFCRDAARAAILALSGSLAPANPTEKGEL